MTAFDDEKLARFLQEHDPAQHIPAQRLARLSERILQKAALTEQVSAQSEMRPLFRPSLAQRASLMLGGFTLLLLGLCVGQLLTGSPVETYAAHEQIALLTSPWLSGLH